MVITQSMLRLPPLARGFHLITDRVESATPGIATCRVGLLHVFLQHTSASLVISENADPDVPRDLERWFNSAVAEDFPFVHTIEGPDDMPAHVKSALMGCSVWIPVRDRRLALGTWQGIFLAEHRDRAGSRSLILTLQSD